MAAITKKLREKTSEPSLSRGRIFVYVAMALLALCGLADATYLTVAHLAGDDSVCGSAAGCATVLSSVYATLGPVPTAAFGVLAYFVVFTAAIYAAFGSRKAHSVIVLVVAVMFLVTLGFLYLQAFVLHAFCPFCLLSAALTFLLTGLAVATWPSR